MNKINIVMTTDKNYINQTSVTIRSILENKLQSSECFFYILNDGNLKDMEKAVLNDVVQQFSSSIEYINIDSDKFCDVKVLEHVPISSFYRILIAEQLTEIERCIFIDGDTVVNIDVYELFSKNLHDNYVAGVRDCGIQYYRENYKSYLAEIGIDETRNYINAGVLVMNLVKIRTDNLVINFIEQMKKNHLMMDQDVINICCKGKIEILPLEYNVFADYLNSLEDLIDTGFELEEIQAAQKKVKIIHFAGKYKPWNFIRWRNGDEWWHSAKKALKPKTYQEMYEVAEELCNKTDWSYILSKCKEKENTVIFGHTQIGKMVYDGLCANEIKNIIAICDNDINKQGQTYRNHEVKALEDIVKEYTEVFYIVTSQRYYGQIREQLMERGVEEKNIIKFSLKSDIYYNNLGKNYLRKEIEESLLLYCGSSVLIKEKVDEIHNLIEKGMKFDEAFKKGIASSNNNYLR